MKYLFTILNLVLYILSLFLLINGSLEMYPTNEQQEKIRILVIIVLIINLIISFILIKKIKKNK